MFLIMRLMKVMEHSVKVALQEIGDEFVNGDRFVCSLWKNHAKSSFGGSFLIHTQWYRAKVAISTTIA